MTKSSRSQKSSAEKRTHATATAPADKRWGFLLAALGLAAVAVGAVARFWAIGRWPVSYDEYLIGKSVRNVLSEGLPRMLDGGYYGRGILLQYLLAGMRLTGLGEELSLRLVPAIFNLAGLPAIYLLARRVSGRSAAWMAVAAYALSAWEIEFSRFARMYAPFQTIFLWFAYFLYRLLVQREERFRTHLYLLALVGIFVHESSVLLAVLLFLPIVLAGRGAKARDLLLSLAVLAATCYVNAIDFRRLGAGAAAGGSHVLRRGLGKLLTPTVLAVPAVSQGAWLMVVALLAGLAGLAILVTLRQKDLPARVRWVLVACVVLACCNLFAAMTLLVLFAFLAAWLRRGEISLRSARWPIIALTASALSWGAYVLGHPGTRAIPGGNGALLLLTSPLFSWPAVPGRLLLPWIGVLPVFCAMSALLLVCDAAIAFYARNGKNGGLRPIGMVLVLGIAFVAVVRTPYVSTRYSFFLYPLLLVADAAALENLTKRWAPPRAAAAVFLACAAAFLLLSEDVRAARLFRVATPQTNFRLADSWFDLNHYIPRVDYRTPAEFIRANRAAGDTVLSLALPLDFYLDRPLEAFYLAREDAEFRNHFDPRTGCDRWSGARIIVDQESLFRFVDEHQGTLWLVAGSESYPYKKAISQTIAARYGAYRRFRSLDGRLEVYGIAAATRPWAVLE